MKKGLIILVLFAGLGGVLAAIILPQRPTFPPSSDLPVTPLMTPITVDQLQGIWYCQESQTMNGMLVHASRSLVLEANGRCRIATNVVVAGIKKDQRIEVFAYSESSGNWTLAGNKMEITSATCKVDIKSIKVNGDEVKSPVLRQDAQSAMNMEIIKSCSQKQQIAILEYSADSVKIICNGRPAMFTRQPR